MAAKQTAAIRLLLRGVRVPVEEGASHREHEEPGGVVVGGVPPLATRGRVSIENELKDSASV